MRLAKLKKKIVLFLALCAICLSFSACATSEKTNPRLTGIWKLNGSYNFSTGALMELNGWRYRGDGTTATLQFSEDGSYELVYSQYGRNEETYTGTYEFNEGSYYLTLNNDNKTKPLTIMYCRDVGALDKIQDSFILITTKEKPENEEENRYFYLLKKYER